MTKKQIKDEEVKTDNGQNGSEAFPEPAKDEIIEARAEGVKDAIRESHKDAYLRGANEGYGDSGAPQNRQIVVDANVLQLRDVLGLSAEELKKRVAEDADNPITEGKVAGLLEMERSGQNRTEYVRVLCDRLGVKSPTEVTAAGPAFTNDTSNISKL